MVLDNLSLEEMWITIEKFGISRKIVDPHDVLRYEQVESLYLAIEEKRIADEQIKLLQEAIDLENMQDVST